MTQSNIIAAAATTLAVAATLAGSAQAQTTGTSDARAAKNVVPA